MPAPLPKRRGAFLDALPEIRQQVGFGQQPLSQANRRTILAIYPMPLVHVDGDETH